MMPTTLSSQPAAQQSNLFSTISRTTLLVGIPAIVAVLIKSYIDTGRGAALNIAGSAEPVSFFTFITHGGPERILKFIASGAFGPEALAGGRLMMVWGLVFHFMIAFVITSILFLIYPLLVRHVKNKLMAGILLGFFTWFVIYLLVRPLSSLPDTPFDLLDAVVNLFILIITVGVPAAMVAHNFYNKKKAAHHNQPA